MKKVNNYIIIDGNKYKKNEDVFKVSNKWVLKENIAIDTFTEQTVLKNKLVSWVDVDGITKYTSKKINIELPQNKIIEVCKSKLNIHNELIAHPSKDNTYIILGKNYNFRSNKFSPSKKVYSVTDSSQALQPYSNIENPLTFLNKYTFGFELETTGISVSKSDIDTLGFYELYDGSITGPEYASGIMSYKNFHHLEYFLKLLQTVSKFNHTCSLHIHVGGIEYSNKNLCAIYSLFQRLQEDLNFLIAPYKKDYKFLYNKQKDHCANLPLLPEVSEKNIKELFKIPNTNDLDNYIKTSQKWNLSGRYYTVNFLNYICKNFPNNTIELRSLQMTFDYNYILTWLLINTSIIDFAVNNSDKVLNKKEKIQIEDVLSYFITDQLILEKVLFNYTKIKNIMYSKKYIENHTDVDIDVDNTIGKLENICLAIFPDSKDINKLCALPSKNVNNIANRIASYTELGSIKVNLSGNFNKPDRSFGNQLVNYLSSALEQSYFRLLSTNSNYVLYGHNILTSGTLPLYADNIESYILVENGDICYIIVRDGNIIEIPFKCDNAFTTESFFYIPRSNIRRNSADEPDLRTTLSSSEEEE